MTKPNVTELNPNSFLTKCCCYMGLCMGGGVIRTSLKTQKKDDVRAHAHTRARSRPNSAPFLLTAWSARWFSPLAHFRVNFPPINVWFPGPYCGLLLHDHTDEFCGASFPACKKYKRSARQTREVEKKKNLTRIIRLLVVTQCKPLLGFGSLPSLPPHAVWYSPVCKSARLQLLVNAPPFPWLRACLTPCDLVSKEKACSFLKKKKKNAATLIVIMRGTQRAGVALWTPRAVRMREKTLAERWCFDIWEDERKIPSSPQQGKAVWKKKANETKSTFFLQTQYNVTSKLFTGN